MTPKDSAVSRADRAADENRTVEQHGEGREAVPFSPLGCHVEYAVMCASGDALKHGVWRNGANPWHVAHTAASLDRWKHSCGPHTVKARIVSDWASPGSVAVWDQQP